MLNIARSSIRQLIDAQGEEQRREELRWGDAVKLTHARRWGGVGSQLVLGYIRRGGMKRCTHAQARAHKGILFDSLIWLLSRRH